VGDLVTRRTMTPPNHVIVIFGANGDLARRKLLPALFHLDREGLMPDDYRIVGSSRSSLSDEGFRDMAEGSVKLFGRCDPSDAQWEAFARRLTYVSTEFGPENAEMLAEAIRKAKGEVGGDPDTLFYLSVPPAAFSSITQGLAKAELTRDARVVFEKPFGWDLRSFQELDATVRSCLNDDQIYRIDHFLGKETVQNILALRFANGMFEPIWNRFHIDHVQIDVPESMGIGTRAGFYEGVGALRDMVVTHLFQVLSFVALEPPYAFTPEALMDEVAKVFESITPLQRDSVVFGQYDGYLDEGGVAKDSRTETFVATRVFVDNWRWARVPFYLRTGKQLAQQRSAVTLAFKEPPKQMFRDLSQRRFEHDHLTIELGPNEGITIGFLAKAPGPAIELDQAHMHFDYEGSFGSELIEAYDRLIHDALMGDRTLFTRADGIARTWELVQPVLDDPPAVHVYPKGAWGPKEADDLIAPHRWHLPSAD
jgi:glucose-6-phosphate 1-dehydrogenase